MCDQPYRLRNGVEAPCRKCQSCREQRVQDYIGRCRAEAHTSDAVRVLTLTYADSPNASYLVYRDVQKMLKLLRRHGYRVRYLIAGEYGEEKGRAHWHGVLFFKGALPVLPEVGVECQMWRPYWPHGFTFVQHPSVQGYRYVLKYVLKAESHDGLRQTPNQTHLAMSKEPALASEFLTGLAWGYAALGSLPPKPVYSVFGAEGYYWLQGHSRRAVLRAFAYRYWSLHGTYPRNLPAWAHAQVFPTEELEWHSPLWEGALERELEWRSWYGTPTQERHGGSYRTAGFSLRQPVRSEVYAHQEFHHTPQVGPRSPLCYCRACRARLPLDVQRLRWIVRTPF